MTIFKHIEQNLLFACKRGNARLRNEVFKGTMLPIARGVFLERKCLANFDQFQINRAIHIARALAVQRRNPVFELGGVTGLMAAGVDQLWEHCLPVMIYAPGVINYGSRKLPEISISDSLTIPSSTVQRTCLEGLSPALEAIRQDVQHDDYLLLRDAVQCARLLPPEQGFVSLNMAVQRLARVGRQDLAASRERLVTISEYCQEIARSLDRGARGRRLLAKAAKGAARPVDSVLESRFLWLLNLQERVAPLPEYETQHEISYWGGSFFADFAFLQEKVIVELDGQGKYGVTEEQRVIARREEQLRQKILESLGWWVLRFKWEDLRQPTMVLGAVERSLHLRRGKRGR